MADIKDAKKLLDEINAAVASYDPALKEQARDILLKQAFGTQVKSSKTAESARGDAADAEGENQPAFHQLVEKWTPTTQGEWVLLGAYYYQVILGNKSLTAFQVNKELKQHGTTISNITMSFEENISQNPALMRQIGKAGKTKQAKKKYIVTVDTRRCEDSRSAWRRIRLISSSWTIRRDFTSSILPDEPSLASPSPRRTE